MVRAKGMASKPTNYIKGPTAVQEYIVNEVQDVYRLQGVKINLMKFILSFPEICARIVCPFPMSTWNVVLGRDSTTTPSTSIMSDFAKRYPSWSG